MERDRKRQRTGDFDYVYPFDASLVVPMPPFIDVGGGLKVDGVKLSLNITEPMKIEKRALTIDLGEGLFLDNGKLSARPTESSAIAPIYVDGGKIGLNIDETSPIYKHLNKLSLKIGNGLETVNSSLQIKIPPNAPMYTSEEGLALKIGGGLFVDVNQAIAIKTGEVFDIDESGNLALNYNSTLTQTSAGQLSVNYDTDVFAVDKDKLSIKTSLPIFVSDNGIGLRYTSPLETNGEELSVKTIAPISNSNGLTLNTDTSLKVNNLNQLTVKFQSPLSSNNDGIFIDLNKPLSDTDGKLTILTGKSTTVFQDLLEVKTSPTGGISISENGLSVNAGNGIVISENRLQADIASPLTIDGNSISISIGNGLEISNTILEVKLDPSNALTKSSSGLGINAASGLMINNNQLKIFHNEGLQINPDGAITVKTQDPLIATSEGLALKLGKGMGLHNNNLEPRLGTGLGWAVDEAIQIRTPSINSGLGIDSSSYYIKRQDPIKVDQNGVGVKLGRGLYLDNGNIRVRVGGVIGIGSQDEVFLRYDNTFTRNSGGQLRVNLGNGIIDINGQLTRQCVAPIYCTDPSGIRLETDSTLTVNEGKLSVASTLGNNGIYATYGDPTLSLFRTKLFGSGSTSGKCCVFASLTWNGGLVNGFLRLRINNKRITGETSWESIGCGFVIDTQGNLGPEESPGMITFVPMIQATRNRLRPNNYYIETARQFQNFDSITFMEWDQLSTASKTETKPIQKQNLFKVYDSKIYCTPIIVDSNQMLYFYINIPYERTTLAGTFYDQRLEKDIILEGSFSYFGLDS